MNKHFEDARYYLGRAGEHAKEGIAEELAPVEERVRQLLGKEKAPEPSRVRRIQTDLKEIEAKAEGEAKKAVHEARQRIKSYRDEDEEPPEQTAD